MWLNIDNRQNLEDQAQQRADHAAKKEARAAGKEDREAEKKKNHDLRQAATAAKHKADREARQAAAALVDHIEQDQAPHLTNLTPLQEYIAEEHPADYNPQGEAVTKEKYDWMAFTGDNHPALSGDPVLEERLGLSDAVKAVQSQQGVIHEYFDPTAVQPAFSSIKPSGHA